LRLNPRSAQTYAALGLALAMQKQVGEAIQMVERAVQLTGGRERALVELLMHLYDMAGRPRPKS